MIEVLYFDGCPNYEPTLSMARQVVRELALATEIRGVEVRTPAEAEELRFLGSPSVRVNGVDIDPVARRRNDFALSCRVYGDSGVPPRELLTEALTERS